METPAVDQLIAWAARFAIADAASVARLRLEPGLRAAVVGGQLWVRGDSRNAAIERLLDLAAPESLYRVDANDRLTPIGHLLATADLPAAQWKPLAELLTIDLMPALAPGALSSRLPLTIVRSINEHPATALLMDFDRFADWCDTAPAVRLGVLRFARQGLKTLVLGSPLPPLAGVPHYEIAGVVVPCGFAVSPAIDPTSLRLLLRISAGDVALFDEFIWYRISADAIAAVTRSGVRMARLDANS